MKLFLALSAEGTTDHRFVPIIIERIISNFFFSKNLTVEFSWIPLPKKGSSYENILRVCKDAKDFHLVFFHRDSGNTSWQNAYTNHFASAIEFISGDDKSLFNKNIIPVIPVTETEAWMLPNKPVLKDKIETTLNDNSLGLTYKVSRIENIADPKSTIERAIGYHNKTLTKKQRRYAVSIGELYDSVASEIPLQDLDVLDSYCKFKKTLIDQLEKIIEK